MKINFFQIILTVMAIFLAIVAAIVLQSQEKKEVSIQGYLVSTPPCTLGIPCSNIIGQVCILKINDTIHQAFGMASPFPTDCTIVVFKE